MYSKHKEKKKANNIIDFPSDRELSQEELKLLYMLAQERADSLLPDEHDDEQ